MHKFSPKNMEKLDNPKRRAALPPEEILKEYGISEDGVFLDIGCGIGYFSEAAARILKNGKVIGIDLSEEMLLEAKRRGGGQENLEYRVCQEYEFPIEKETVRFALLSNVLHEIDDKRRYLKEILRVLEPDGKLFLLEWVKEVSEMGPPVDERLSNEDVSDLAVEAGFRSVRHLFVRSGHNGFLLAK